MYEQCKRFMNPRGEYSPASHIISGAVAGAVAAAVTTPLDVAKTILQTRGTSSEPDIKNVGGMTDAFRVIWKRDGLKGFGRGLTPRVLTIMPSTALCWLSYEFFSEYQNAWISYLSLTIQRQRPQYEHTNIEFNVIECS